MGTDNPQPNPLAEFGHLLTVQSQAFSLRRPPTPAHIRSYICCHELAANLESVHFEQRVGVSGISFPFKTFE
ncbi:hypothetical protein NQZ68_018817 [Dissostichus eleginoides]|nr:hypothetical protein NQZ68_018817 [Dissostichus eleginoides]